MKRAPVKSPTVWIGECVCGLLVYETEDGKRYDTEKGWRHLDSVCEKRKGENSGESL